MAGGAVFNYNNAFIGSITGNFLNNYSRAAGTGNVALGGAVYTAKKMTFAAGEQKTYFISGNYTPVSYSHLRAHETRHDLV